MQNMSRSNKKNISNERRECIRIPKIAIPFAV